MDTQDKRTAIINMSTFGATGLTPTGAVDSNDAKNYLWLPIWLVYSVGADASWISETKLLITTANII